MSVSKNVRKVLGSIDPMERERASEMSFRYFAPELCSQSGASGVVSYDLLPEEQRSAAKRKLVVWLAANLDRETMAFRREAGAMLFDIALWRRFETKWMVLHAAKSALACVPTDLPQMEELERVLAAWKRDPNDLGKLLYAVQRQEQVWRQFVSNAATQFWSGVMAAQLCLALSSLLVHGNSASAEYALHRTAGLLAHRLSIPSGLSRRTGFFPSSDAQMNAQLEATRKIKALLVEGATLLPD